jgi:capsular polysaccharide transport system ATP-binding protein
VIAFEHLTKQFSGGGARTIVVDDLNLVLPAGRSVALLGRNGAGKSTLLQMIAGNIRPDSGRIVVNGTVSWPVGYAGTFHPELTGAQNTRFTARIHGAQPARISRISLPISPSSVTISPCRSAPIRKG